jgi:hypothetical protein
MEPNQPIRVVVGDGIPLERDLARIFLRKGGYRVVGQAATSEDLIWDVRRRQPDVVVLGQLLLDVESSRAIDAVRAVAPSATVALITMLPDEALGGRPDLLLERGVGLRELPHVLEQARRAGELQTAEEAADVAELAAAVGGATIAAEQPAPSRPDRLEEAPAGRTYWMPRRQIAWGLAAAASIVLAAAAGISTSPVSEIRASNPAGGQATTPSPSAQGEHPSSGTLSGVPSFGPVAAPRVPGVGATFTQTRRAALPLPGPTGGQSIGPSGEPAPSGGPSSGTGADGGGTGDGGATSDGGNGGNGGGPPAQPRTNPGQHLGWVNKPPQGGWHRGQNSDRGPGGRPGDPGGGNGNGSGGNPHSTGGVGNPHTDGGSGNPHPTAESGNPHQPGGSEYPHESGHGNPHDSARGNPHT